MASQQLTIRDRLDQVEERIEHALARSRRARSDIELVAITKKFSASVIAAGYENGLRCFGENYVQEFAGKRTEFGELPDARFVLIGQLQSNKARLATTIFDEIHTVDSLRLLTRIDAAAAESKKKMRIFLEVKLSSEEAKHGLAPESARSLVDAAAGLAHVQVEGLMTMPPWSEDGESARPYFRSLAQLAADLALPELSMGTSNDFEVAIEEGATSIRLGTALFGSRPKPVPSP